MTDDIDSESADAPEDDASPTTRWPLIAGAAVAVIGIIVAAILLTGGGDDDGAIDVADSSTSSTLVSSTDESTTTPAETSEVTVTTTVADTTDTTNATDTTTSAVAATTTSTATATTTSAVATTTTGVAATTTTLPITPDMAIWPWVDSELRFTDPVEAAESFAFDYVEFDDPVVGEFQAGDSRSGEVEVRPFEGGPVTVVFVRQVSSDNSWWVIGAATESIVVDTPQALSVIGSPVTVSGAARAFEGTVYVEIRADDDLTNPFEEFVTGSGGPDLGDFEETFTWEAPASGGGAMLFLSLSSEDDSVLEVSAIRVFFGAVT